jgi:hypothetical protein
MSLLQSIESMIGGGDLQRLSAGQGNFQDPNSPDHQHLQNMVANTEPSQLQGVLGQVAQRMDPQQYANHVGGSAGGGAFGNLGSGALGTIASALMTHLTGSGGFNASSLLSKIPGLGTTDPNQMNSNQVAALAQYTQQNHPDAFGRAAAQVGQQQPSLLNSFLGKAGLAIGAAALASHFIKTSPSA